MGAYAVNDDVAWGDDKIASHLKKQEEHLKTKFSSLLDAQLQASGAAADMLYGVKGSLLYKEAEKILDEAIAYIKKFKEKGRVE
ncbi:MAG: hypothetical protein PHE77_00670 [Candidatus Pacebacteria bacterium]|nr:hypothetical protein [Candidatus Paceibacterota bacterium]